MSAIVHGMPNAEYHRHDAIGSSGLRLLGKSPAHYFARYLDPARPALRPTPSQIAGTLAHCALLEPYALAVRYLIRPDGLDGRTKDGKAWLAEHAHSGAEIITADQLVTARRQAAAVRSLPEIAALVGRGEAEVSAFWTDDETGVACKCRPDCVHSTGDGDILVDLKTCQDASPSGFARSVANYSYHLQAAWYCDGWTAASGRPVLGFVFAAVEADYPHAAAAYMLDEDAMTRGRAECRRLLNLYAECRRADAWPGYSAEIQPLSLPTWA